MNKPPADRPTGWGGDPVEQPSLATLRAAAQRLAGRVVHTPLVPLHSDEAQTDIYLKPETLQPVGSFKLRGVLNWAAALTDGERARGLSTTSAGNTAQALGYVARTFNVSARTLVPDTIPQNKYDAIAAYGVVLVKKPFPELLAFMLEERWRDESFCYLNPWGDPHLVAGHGTLGLEIAADMPDVRSIFVPVGGGGLIAGVGSAVKAVDPGMRIIAVQSDRCPALETSFARGLGGWIESRPGLCDGTAVPLIVDQMYPLLRRVVDDVITVSDHAVKAAIRQLALKNKLVVEGSGALALAGALSVSPAVRGKSVCVLSGGSIDAEKLAAIITC